MLSQFSNLAARGSFEGMGFRPRISIDDIAQTSNTFLTTAIKLHEQKTAGYNELGMPVSVHARAYDDTDLVLTLRRDGPKGPELRIIYLNDLVEYDSVIPKSFINLNDFDYNDNDPVFLDITVIELVDVPPVGQKV